MPRYATSLLLAFILLNTLSPARPQDPTVVLAEDVSQAPFVLSVPTSLIRANNGLQIVMHDDGAGQGLIFTLGPDEIVVTLRRGGEATELARAQAPLPAEGGAVVLKRLSGGFAVAYDAVTVLRMDADLPDGGRWGITGTAAAALDEIAFQPVEQVVFRGIAEPTARLAELQAGTIDIAVLLSVDDLQTVQNDPNLITAIPTSELNVGYIAMHQANEPLDNLLVRQAIAHAIDREAIIEAFYGGLGVTAQGFVPSTMFGQPDPWPYTYDPERARELLAEAGFPDGFSTEFWYMPVSRPYYPAPQPIAETIASFLADVGITVELMTEDWTTYLADYQTGKFPMYMLGWNADYADPDNFLLTFFGPSAVTDLGWDDPETRDLLQQARQVADQDVRAGLYAQVGNNVAEAVAMIPFAHNRTLNAMRSNISGWVPSPLGYSSVSLHSVTKAE